MTHRHRVFFDSEWLFTYAHEHQVDIEFDNANDIAICVVDGVEWAAHVPTAVAW